MRILRLLLVASALFAGACTVSLTVEASLYAKPTTYVVATEPPPPPREDVTPGPRPSDASVWVEGHWSWNGRWEWTPGAWKEPREGHVWEPPVCVVEDGRYEYFPGYFRPREEAPPPVYREPGHVQLHVPAPEVRPSTQLPDRIVVRPGVELPRTTGPGLSTDAGTHPVDTTPTLPGDLTTPPETTPPTQQPPAMECSLAITRAAPQRALHRERPGLRRHRRRAGRWDGASGASGDTDLARGADGSRGRGRPRARRRTRELRPARALLRATATGSDSIRASGGMLGGGSGPDAAWPVGARRSSTRRKSMNPCS
ncbi:MAG: YXWGXW repeat-containing protein [Polyangiales bacterium]